MQRHAGRANDSLRKFRKKYDEDEDRWESSVREVAARQEVRFWKRVAMPELEDDDSYWSGDDDVIDPAEKDRLREVEARVLQEQMGGEEEEEQGGFQHLGVMGGIAMQREESGHGGLPPQRPGSAASSTGSTGA